MEIELAPDPRRAKERLGGSFSPGVEAVLWFPLSQEGGWLALPLPGEQEPCCGSDYYPWIYIPVSTRNCRDSAPIYMVSGPLATMVRIQAGQAAVALNRHWLASHTKDGEQGTDDCPADALSLPGKTVPTAARRDFKQNRNSRRFMHRQQIPRFERWSPVLGTASRPAGWGDDSQNPATDFRQPEEAEINDAPSLRTQDKLREPAFLWASLLS